jgi:hypothetical protein
MVRPSVASLNSLAEVLRQAQPLYDECGSILNHLADSARLDSALHMNGVVTGSAPFPISDGEDSIHRTVLELTVRTRIDVM